MPWCPKCKCEYEEGIENCADCNIPLVDNLDDAKLYKGLISVTKEEASNVVEFLNYSNIEDVVLKEAENNQVHVCVNENDVKDAMKYLNVYLYEQAKENQNNNEEDFYIDEYVTEELDPDDQVKEMQSSYLSFVVIGVLTILFSGANLLGIIRVVDNSMMLMMLLVIGIIFVGIGIFTKVRMPDLVSEAEGRKNEVDIMVKYYEEHNDLTSFYTKHGIKQEGQDEGALYFAVIDIIKGEMAKAFPDAKAATINTAAEIIYNEKI